ncbi:unnamed protein product [Rotaria sp. Silwood1]|nr:unnamed protein product [Rotaria sp. Silwood1]CAF4596951.1 unnamed protein product [Rotaria sp. Silwood1]
MDRCLFWKIALVLGILLSLVAFILGWIGFGVPDWQGFQRYNGSIAEFYGLWAYCQAQSTSFGTVCNRWSTAEDALFNGSRPNFIRTSEGLITVGMVFLSLGLAIAIVAAILPLIAYVAAFFALISFIFLVIGLPIFGRQANALSAAQGNYTYGHLYGFWLIVPTIVLEFLAMLFFLAAAVLYKLCGYGNILSGLGKTVGGGQQVLGPYNKVGKTYGVGPAYGMGVPGADWLAGMGAPGANLPYGMGAPGLYPASAPPYHLAPTLLSQYLNQQVPRPAPQLVARLVTVSSLPQPSIARAIAPAPMPNVLPDYYRIGEPAGPPFRPIINLTGQTLVGPLIRTR